MTDSSIRALIVDDEADICELMVDSLTPLGLDCVTAADLGTARNLLDKQAFSLCFCDMRLPDGEGIELVEFIQEHYAELPVAVITAYGNMELAVQCLKAGAFDFVSKPIKLKVLRDLVQTALKMQVQIDTESKPTEKMLLGESASMQHLRRQIAKVARSQAPVLITGPSGVGKELVARSIHTQSPRADHPFVPVNCGAIAENLMESELFGHKKGSFTGAVADADGLFRAANGGTLFLDEVAELPIHMQVKLLRAIQEKAIRPVGGKEEIPVDVRILSATHRDLPLWVSEDKFRQDLYYRINVIELNVPPLHDRPEDIVLLAEHFLAQFCLVQQRAKVVLTQAALEKLQAYHFAGNVRELENVLERALTLCEHDSIDADDILLRQTVREENAERGDNITADKPDLSDASSLQNYVEDMERQQIIAALEKTRWNKTQAAKELGITLRALRYRMQKLGVQ